MKNAIVLHGIASSREQYDSYSVSMSNFYWYPVIQWDLTRRGVLTQTPEMPDPYFPNMNYDEWVKVISGFDINENTILIGHSCGGGFWLKYLSNNQQIKIKQLILVAPWINPLGEPTKFFDNLNLDVDLSARCGQIDLFISSDDHTRILKSFDKIYDVFGDKIKYHKFDNKGHFSEDIGAVFQNYIACTAL